MVVKSDFIESSVLATFVFHSPLMDLGKVAKMVSMEILREPTHTNGQLTEGQAWGICYSWAALSSNDSKTV